MAEMNPDVLVVGGGPVGLTMASELFRHGLRCRVIDMKEAPSVWSKAAGIQPRTLEVFQDMGLVEEVVARGRKIFGLNVYTYKAERKIAHLTIDIPGTPYPYILGLSQRETELLLAEHLKRMGGELERPVQLEGFFQDKEGVTATLKKPDGSRETVRARWLIGCDGAHSTVREVLGLPFEGSTFAQLLIQADIKIHFPFPVDRNEGVLFLSENGAIGALPLFDEDSYRLIIIAPPEERSAPTLENFQALIEERCSPEAKVSDPAWMVDFRFHGRMVPEYRVGRAFLAGDAAHIHSPAGAQGMNLGIQDAYNLAWKLALVQKGKARPALLDSYHAERHPIASATVHGTDFGTRTMLRAINLRNPLARGLRNQLMSFVLNLEAFQNRIFQIVSGVTVDYRKSPIVGQYHSSFWSSKIRADRSTEIPSMKDWLHFGHAPGPGERVPDIDLSKEMSGIATLFDLLRGTKHTLFLFDGAAATPEGYRTLSGIAEKVEERYKDLIRIYVVVPFAQRPEALLWEGEVLLDPEVILHHHFGAGAESLYLIRPDGYVGYRSQPADEGKLFAYLETLFTD